MASPRDDKYLIHMAGINHISGRGSGCFPRSRFVALNHSRMSSVPLGIPPPPSAKGSPTQPMAVPISKKSVSGLYATFPNQSSWGIFGQAFAFNSQPSLLRRNPDRQIS
ncbi:hypothetical protein TNCV_4099761 [Trichonephila clavipes]|nr:hypothetical protein TNCV_4099761 [Trichonephila clavipes]